jgi:NRPS condensation-like uncharacterized protein
MRGAASCWTAERVSVTGKGTISSTVRIPLSPLDQGLFHLDQGPMPWSCHFEVRVPGRLEERRVRAAAIAAANHHPIARASLAPYRGRDRQLFWEIPDEVDDVAVEVVDCHDDAELAQARSRLLAQRVDLQSGPPFALMLAHHPHGDSLIMNLNHVAGDGTSGLLLLRSIANAYAGIDDTFPPASPSEVRDLQEAVAARPKGDSKQPKHGGPNAGIAVAGGQPGVPGLGFCHLRFDKSATAAIVGRRVHPATVNDLLLASLAIAIRRHNDESGVPVRTVSLGMPVDLRPAGHAREILANVVWAASVPIFADEQADLVVAELAVAERTQLVKARRTRGDLVELPPGLGTWPIGVLHRAARGLIAGPVAKRMADRLDTVALANLGRLDRQFDFGAAAGAATECWCTPPALMPPGLGFCAVSIDDELFLGMRYCHEQFDAPAAARFAETWRDVLTAG